MNYILDDGNIFNYECLLENKINKGSTGAIYNLDNSKCLKIYFKDAFFKIEEDIFYLMKELNLNNFCKLDNLLYKDDILVGYIMDYYEKTKENILFKSMDYILDNFNTLYNSFIVLSNNGIMANDARLGNSVIGDNSITMIDFDFYLKSDENINLIKENNISKLLLIFNKLFYYSLKEICTDVPLNIEIMLDNIFSYSNNPVKKLNKILNNYSKPIDLFIRNK